MRWVHDRAHPELVEGLALAFRQAQCEREGAQRTVLSVYAVFASREEAERIGRQVIDERLAACINILPGVQSIYRWQDAVEYAEEAAAILKTTAARADALIARIAELHSYEVPCITTWPVDRLFAPYAEWVEEACARPPIV